MGKHYCTVVGKGAKNPHPLTPSPTRGEGALGAAISGPSPQRGRGAAAQARGEGASANRATSTRQAPGQEAK